MASRMKSEDWEITKAGCTFQHFLEKAKVIPAQIIIRWMSLGI